MSALRVSYALAMSHPHSHLFEVTVTIDGWTEPHLELVMPSWTPGSYLIREYARHVRDFAAECDGRPTPWTKTAKDAWRVTTPPGGRVRASYKVYAHELTVRTPHLDGTHGFVVGTAVFMFVQGRTGEPVSLEVTVPMRWQVATGLEPQSGGSNIFRFRARDYDELVDAPLECGTHRLLAFEVEGTPHRLAVWGKGNEDDAKLVADVQAIVAAERAFFGAFPYRHYTFIVHLASGRGGLEHRNSAVLLADRWGFKPRASYERFLELVAHEYFHAWNVKKIRPAPLGPFDYRRENHTRQLWSVEGVTSYYEKRFTLAAGLYSKERFLERIGEEIAALASQPGRSVQSLEAASFDAWIKQYRPDENSANSSVSYYLKGALVAALLDLEIRAATSRAKCLDDVLKHLWRQATLDDAGFAEPDGFLVAVETVAGGHDGRFRHFFQRFVAGTDPLDYDASLSHAGLALRWKRNNGEDAATGWLGCTARPDGPTTIVQTVRTDGPAYAAGIYPGDEIVAVDGHRADGSRLAARLSERSVGANVRLTLFRRDELLVVPVALAEAPNDLAAIVAVEGSSAAQKALREAWLSPFQR